VSDVVTGFPTFPRLRIGASERRRGRATSGAYGLDGCGRRSPSRTFLRGRDPDAGTAAVVRPALQQAS
jgi:hypothetical protein